MSQDMPHAASGTERPPNAGAAATSPAASRRPNAFGRLNRWLGRINIWAATALLAGIAVVMALSFTLALMEAGLYGDRTKALWGVTAVTLLVAIPIVYHAQRIIRQLSASRRTLRLMTERLALALDNAERANEEKSRFLATMSHELRTPLNAIIGFSDIMMHERLGPMANLRYRGYAEDINGSGQHLLAIIDEILDLAKIESGTMPLDDSTDCDLATVCEAAVTMVRPLAARQGVRLHIALPDRAVRLRAAERMLRQIAINLLSNAVKFTHAGGDVTLAADLRANGNLMLAVSDTGIGMSAEDIRVALTPFGQVRNAMSGRHPGTGLGLPLAKAMLELHDGRLSIRSRPGQGTTVVLTFPAARVAAGPTGPAPEPQPHAAADGGRRGASSLG